VTAVLNHLFILSNPFLLMHLSTLLITCIAVATLQCSGPIFGEYELLHCFFIFCRSQISEINKSTRHKEEKKRKIKVRTHFLFNTYFKYTYMWMTQCYLHYLPALLSSKRERLTETSTSSASCNHKGDSQKSPNLATWLCILCCLLEKSIDNSIFQPDQANLQLPSAKLLEETDDHITHVQVTICKAGRWSIASKTSLQTCMISFFMCYIR